MNLFPTSKEPQMSTVNDYSRAMTAISNTLHTLPAPVQTALQARWEAQGCLGLVRGCQAITRAFPGGNEAEALNAIKANALNLERMIAEDVRSINQAPRGWDVVEPGPEQEGGAK